MLILIDFKFVYLFVVFCLFCCCVVCVVLCVFFVGCCFCCFFLVFFLGGGRLLFVCFGVVVCFVF